MNRSQSPGQVAMQGKLGGEHLVADRAHSPVGIFSLQQVLDQPLRCRDRAFILFFQFAPCAGHPLQTQFFQFSGDITHD
jgi:hypothetical protein